MVKREIWFVIVLSIFTFGIYFFYWIYAFSKDIQTLYEKNDVNPGLEVVLCIITLGIYGIYWMYKYGKLIANCQEKYNLPIEDNSIIYLILAIFDLSIVNVGLMQNQLNNIIDASTL